MPRHVHDYSRARRKSWRGYRVRCSRCRHRKTFKKHPDFHVRLPACVYCGCRKWVIDWFRTSKIEAKRYTCRCGAIPADRNSNSMPHRRGSTRNFHGYEIACKHKASERKAA